MQRSTFTMLMATIVAAGGLCSLAWRASPEPVAGPVSDALASLDVSTLDDSRRWMKVTGQPFHISAVADSLCRAPVPADYDSERAKNPHVGAMINVYVNTIGSPAMRAFGTTVFPQGSVIVKEKFYREPFKKKPDKPSLYTVMVKRERGYNPELGDWQFAVISGDGKQILAQGQLENCMQCHRSLQKTDHVFGTYLHREIEPKLPPK